MGKRKEATELLCDVRCRARRVSSASQLEHVRVRVEYFPCIERSASSSRDGDDPCDGTDCGAFEGRSRGGFTYDSSMAKMSNMMAARGWRRLYGPRNRCVGFCSRRWAARR